MERYPDLPYNYVFKAYKAADNLRQKQLHHEEIPIANLAAIYTNSKRDTKKSKKPFSFKDFCFYAVNDESNGPGTRYGSAAVALVHEKRYPSWALFCFPELKASHNPNLRPDNLALIAEDAILLAPIKTSYGWLGFLIAQESASDSVRVFEDDEGNQVRLLIPFIETKIVAREDVYLTEG